MDTIKLREVLDEEHMKITDFENFFAICQTESDTNYKFNLNSTVYISTTLSKLSTYECTCNCHWPLLSYKIYGTTHLAWILLKVNKVQAKDIFNIKYPGDIIYYIPKEQINSIIKTINGYN